MPKTTILLRSAWQTVNIGDITHTPGVLHVLEQQMPDATIILWSGPLDRGVEPMLRRRFPKLRIVRDAGWKTTSPRSDDPTREQAIAEADLFLHGSGPSLVGQAAIQEWRKATQKPYGIYGVTLGSQASSPDTRPHFSPELQDILDNAAFLFTRETTSLKQVKNIGVRTPHLDFTPDGTFAVDLHNDAAAKTLLKESSLEPGKYLCAIPRLRVTPYWKIHPENKYTPEEIATKTALNEKYAESDHAKLRESIIAWVRETGMKVFICPEMTYEVDIIRPLVYDPLPADIKEKVVPMTRYWLPDEAASVYRTSRAVISMECHSPIIANANGIPGLYLRQPTDTWKGQMYPDLGLDNWIFEIDTASGREIAERLLQVHTRYDDALRYAKAASQRAKDQFAKTMQIVRKTAIESRNA